MNQPVPRVNVTFSANERFLHPYQMFLIPTGALRQVPWVCMHCCGNNTKMIVKAKHVICYLLFMKFNFDNLIAAKSVLHKKLFVWNQILYIFRRFWDLWQIIIQLLPCKFKVRSLELIRHLYKQHGNRICYPFSKTIIRIIVN